MMIFNWTSCKFDVTMYVKCQLLRLDCQLVCVSQSLSLSHLIKSSVSLAVSMCIWFIKSFWNSTRLSFYNRRKSICPPQILRLHLCFNNEYSACLLFHTRVQRSFPKTCSICILPIKDLHFYFLRLIVFALDLLIICGQRSFVSPTGH